MDHWDTSVGIPSNSIRAIAQTPDDYLWIGTSLGLVRFDGMKFSILSFPGEADTVPREIQCLFVDRKGTLWIGSDKGLTSYHCKTGQVKTFTGADGITEEGIRCINEDVRGNIWVSFTTSYVNRFSNEKFKTFDSSHGLEGKRINTMVEDGKGNLLFGTSEKGIFIYKDGKFSSFPITGLNNVRVSTMYEDRKGILWIGTNKGLFTITDKGTGRLTTRNGLSNDYITDIMEDSEGNIWVGTGNGLNRLKKEKNGPITLESMLQSSAINRLYEDREKSLWIGTDTAGIKRLKDGKFISYEPLEAHPQLRPLAIFEDRDGNTWIGTHSGTLLRCRGGELIESVAYPGISGTCIAAIAEDGAGNLWLGTIGKGVFRKKNGTFTQFTTIDGLADNQVTSIFRDSRGNLWFSTFDGVSVRRSRSGLIELFTSRGGLSGKVVNNVYEDKTNNIWIAADKGITVLKDGKITNKNIKYYLQDIPITCIYEEVDSSAVSGNVFWIATNGAGLKRYRDGKFFSYNTAHGMTTNYIYQFLEDQQGNFWLMSDSGILRVSKHSLNRFAKGSNDKIHCRSFGLSDGLKSPEFDNESSRNSVLKTSKGDFWFITKKGISIVNPGKVLINKLSPHIVIEEVFVDDQLFPLRRDAQAYTFRGKKDLSFRFTAPTFLSPEKIKFKYQLSGFDRVEVSLAAGTERIAHYKDLAPGIYTFKVTACNADGVGYQTWDSLTLTLKPFFYQTLLFKIALLFLLLTLSAAAFYIYKKRPFRKKAKYKGAPLHPDFAEECIKKLRHLMEIEKVYVDADMSLQSLAERMSISPHQLSQLLNERLDRNFADFINFYRIEEAKRILKSPEGAQQKIDAVAFDVGFNTSVVFYRAFKKFTDITPTQFKKEVEKLRS